MLLPTAAEGLTPAPLQAQHRLRARSVDAARARSVDAAPTPTPEETLLRWRVGATPAELLGREPLLLRLAAPLPLSLLRLQILPWKWGAA